MARTTNNQPRAIGAGIAAFKASLGALKGKQTTPGATARRTFLAGAFAMPAAAMGADCVEAAATKLASAMAARHGGRRAAHIDHETGFILIQLLPSKRRGGAA